MFPFNDNFLKFFLSILDDEKQKLLEGFDEDPFFNTIGFVGTLDNDLEESFRLIEDKSN